MEKRKKVVLTIISIIILFLLVSSGLFIIYDLYLFTGILGFYRIIGSLLVAFITLIIVQESLISLKKEKIVRYIITLIIGLTFSLIFVTGGYYIYKVISSLEMNSNTNTYSVSLITFNKEYKKLSQIDNLKIGIVDDEADITNYVLPMEFIKSNKLDDLNEIVKYSDIYELVNALYEEEIDVIFINSDYKNLYGKLEEFKKLVEKAIVIKTYEKDKKNIDNNTSDNSEKKLTEPFTMLLLGVDSEAEGLNPNSSFNGDTLILVTFNPNTLNATMLSIPRDTFVSICGGRSNKINASAWGGVSCVQRTIENFTGIKIDYYAMINFKGVVSLVDQLGGITVDVPEPDYLGVDEYCADDSNRAQKICLEPGVQKLDGEHALLLSRIRYAFLRGDFQRGQNQQLVIEGIINELKNIRSVNKVISILDIINKNIATNLSKEQILSFYDVGKKMMLGNNTNLINIQKTFLEGSSWTLNEPGAGERSYVFHSQKSLNAIVKAMQENLGLLETTPIKNFTFSINEKYEKEIIGAGLGAGTRPETVPQFYSIEDAVNWANSKGITYRVVDINTNSNVTDYKNYKLSSQDPISNTMVIRVNSIIIYAENKNPATVEKPDDDTKPNDGDNTTTTTTKATSSTTTTTTSSSTKPVDGEE